MCLVSFCVEPAAIDLSRVDTSLALTLHIAFLGFWRDVGHLTHDGDDFSSSSLGRAVEALPQSIRTRWQVMLRSRLRMGTGQQVACIESAESTLALEPLRGLVNLALMEEARAAYVGLPDGDASTLLPSIGIEIARYDSFLMAQTVSSALRLRQTNILSGERLGKVWTDRLEPYARRSRHITIVDAYCGARQSQRRYGGLHGFFQRIDGLGGPGSSLTVICAVGTELRCNESDCKLAVENAWRTNSGRGGIRALELRMIPDYEFREYFHERYIRFDNTVIELGSGLQLFEESLVERTTTFAIKDVIDAGAREVEKRLTMVATSVRFG